MFARPRHIVQLLVVVLGAVTCAAPTASAANFTVNSAPNVLHGSCAATCSLGDAVEAARTTAGADTIIVPAGTWNGSGLAYTSGARGDLTIIGAGASATTVTNSGGTASMWDIAAPSNTITLRGISFVGPSAIAGATSFLNHRGGTVVLDHVDVHGFTSPDDDTMFVMEDAGPARLEVLDSRIRDNASAGPAIATQLGAQVLIERSEISANDNTVGDTGGVSSYGAGTLLTVRNSTIFNNHATGADGGIRTAAGGTTHLVNATIANNRADAGPGGIGQDSGSAVDAINTIIVGNLDNGTPSDCQALGGANAFASLGHNRIGTLVGACAASATGDLVNPAFTTQLGTFGIVGGANAVVPFAADSTFVDAGDATACAAQSGGDQRGGSRSVGACDIGAYELGGVTDTRASVSVGTSTSSLTVGKGSITWTINVTNLGPDAARGAKLALTVPAGVSGVALGGALSSTCALAASNVTCTIPLINVAETLSLTVAGTPSVAGALLALTATLTPTGADATPSENTATSASIRVHGVAPIVSVILKGTTFAVKKTTKAWTFPVTISCPANVYGACNETIVAQSARKLAAKRGAKPAFRKLVCPKVSIPAGGKKTITCSVPKLSRIYFANKRTTIRMTFNGLDAEARKGVFVRTFTLKG